MTAFAVKNILRNSLEIPLVLVLVFSAFLLLLTFLNLVFPLGTPLKYIVDEQGLLAGTKGMFSSNPVLAVEYNGQSEALTADTEIAANLESVHRSVKRKPADTISWANASSGMNLYSRDAIQTFEQARALIRFDEENYIDLGENSLVIIKRMNDDPLLREKLTRILVFAGELRGKISATSRKRMQMEIRSQNAVTKVMSAQKDKATLFKYKINPDKTSTVTVLEGQAVIVDKGRKVSVNPFEAYTVTPGEEPSELQVPPGSVKPVTPTDGASFYYNELPPAVKFVWSKEANADAYTVQVARDRHFKDVITSEKVKSTYLMHGNLKQGMYYWRVRAENGWVEGDFNESRTFSVIRDNIPPELQVEMPPDTSMKRTFAIKGKTEPGSRVFINNQPVKVGGEGVFEYQLQLDKGSNTVVVEAVDTAGNSSYQSKIVNIIGK
ncbi:MAG: hypothetical protein L0Z73_20255 [Gammaproteobacteria bacterium]|nr:hypothetical protein [Gammaproteobacteria bacterium]